MGNIISFEKKALSLIKEKEQLAFYNVELINKQLEVFNQIAEKENIEEKSKTLMEQAVWINTISYYFNYNDPKSSWDSIIEKWTENEEDRIGLKNLLSSVSSAKTNSTDQKVLSDVLNSFWSMNKFKQGLNNLKIDDQKHDLFPGEEKWLDAKLGQINNFEFQTDTALEIYSGKKRKNYGQLEKMLKNLVKEKDYMIQEELKIDAAELKALKKKLKGVEGRSERGVETMFRLASKNLYTRARILDSKSSILITVNSIILSVVLGTLYSQIVNDPHLIMPVTVLFLTNLASIGYSIIASRPELKKGKFLREDVQNKKASLLNFDDYHAVPIEDYVWAMDQAANDAEYLYHTIIWDLHHMGTRMHNKYRNLKIAYNIFMFGLIISISLFMACHLFFDWN